LGDWAGASTTAAKITSALTRAKALIAITREQFRGERRDLAALSVNSAIEAARLAGKHKGDLLCKIAHTQAAAGDLEAATQTMALATEPSSISRGFAQIAAEAALRGDGDRAQQLFAKARRALAEVKGIREAVSHDVVAHMLRAGDFDGATDLTVEIGAGAASGDFVTRVAAINNRADALRELVTELVKRGLHEQALTAITRVTNGLSELSGLDFLVGGHAERRTTAALATCYAIAGDFTTAIEMVRKMGGLLVRSPEREKALKDIAVAQAARGDFNVARDTLKSALSTARSRRKLDAFRYEEVIGEIAVTSVNIGDLDLAQEALNDISDAARKASTLRRIAAAVSSKASNEASIWFSQAATAADTIDDSYSRATTMADIAVEQARRGLGDSAVHTAARILTSRSSLVPMVARALYAEKNFAAVKALLVPCSQDRESAVQMCSLLVRLDAARATAVVALIDRTSPGVDATH